MRSCPDSSKSLYPIREGSEMNGLSSIDISLCSERVVKVTMYVKNLESGWTSIVKDDPLSVTKCLLILRESKYVPIGLDSGTGGPDEKVLESLSD